MIAHQKMVATDGKEVLLFPLAYMYISQGENGSYSHQGTYNIDFLGYDANGRVYQCPYYAPCTLKCVRVSSTTVDWESVEKVHFADGTLDYVTIGFTHDDNTNIHYVGEIIQQGDLIGHTGTAGNVTGDHVHMNTARGHYQGYYDVGTGQYQLVNSTHIYETMYDNNTVIVQGYGYNWIEYQDGIASIKKTKFPFVLYARKIREKSHNR